MTEPDALPFWLTLLPTANAVLNSTAALLLLAGYVAVRRGRIRTHRTCMLLAVLTSTVFLATYVTYHTLRQMATGVGHTPFTGTGLIRPIYFGVLVSHLILAMTLLPLVGTTLYRALRGRFEAHARLARWTWPIWMYVSVTGVAVYVMLYRI